MFGLSLRPQLRDFTDFTLIGYKNGNEIKHEIYKDDRLVSYQTREDLGWKRGFVYDEDPGKAVYSFATQNKRFKKFLQDCGDVVRGVARQKFTPNLFDEYFKIKVHAEECRETSKYIEPKVFVYLYRLGNLQLCEAIDEIQKAKKKKD